MPNDARSGPHDRDSIDRYAYGLSTNVTVGIHRSDGGFVIGTPIFSWFPYIAHPQAQDPYARVKATQLLEADMTTQATYPTLAFPVRGDRPSERCSARPGSRPSATDNAPP